MATTKSNEIEVISISKLTNSAHEKFMSLVVKLAKEDEKIYAKCKDSVDKLAESAQTEDDNFKKSTKDIFTEDIAKADSDQDGFYTVFKQTVNTFSSISIPNMQEAAKVLIQHINTYNINTSSQLDTEANDIRNFIQDIEQKYNAQVETLNLMPLVQQLKTANDKVLSLLKARNDAKIGKVTGVLKAARMASDENYRNLVKYVNAYALIEGDSDYAHFIERLNIEIKHYKEQIM